MKIEFVDFMNLKPIKINIIGSPFSGKSLLAKKLAKYFNLCYINFE